MNIVGKYSHDWIKNKYDNGGDMKFIYFWGHTEKGGGGHEGLPEPMVRICIYHGWDNL